MRFILLLLSIYLFIPADSWAQFEVAIQQGNEVILQGRRLLKAMAIIAIMAVSAMTMTGKVPWGWGFAIIAALILLSLVELDKGYSIQNWILRVGTDRQANTLEEVVTTVATELDEDGTNQSGAVFGSSLSTDLKGLIQAFAGIAIVGLAIVGFSGRFPFKWIIAVVGALGILFVGETFVDNAITIQNQEDAVRQLFEPGEQASEATYSAGRTILYGIGALATIGLAISAMMGQWRWGIAFSIVAGLGVIAAIQGGLTYLTGEGAVLTQMDNVGNVALPGSFSRPTMPPIPNSGQSGNGGGLGNGNPNTTTNSSGAPVPSTPQPTQQAPVTQGPAF